MISRLTGPEAISAAIRRGGSACFQALIKGNQSLTKSTTLFCENFHNHVIRPIFPDRIQSFMTSAKQFRFILLGTALA